MDRIAVVGSCGAGKSWLSTRLGELLGLPVVHLDRLYWKRGWIESTRAEFERAQDRALPPDGRWIVDGNYSGTMALRLARADTVVLLDLPTHVCLRRVIGRAWRQLGHERADMAEGCPERLFSLSYLQFLLYVFNFRRKGLPFAQAKIAEHALHAPLFHLRSDGEIARFVDGITRGAGGTADRRERRG